MSGYKTFAVAGAGNLGKFVVEELLSKKNSGVISSVILLTRNADERNELVAKGAKPVVIDYNSLPSIQSALSGVDVVISTLPPVANQDDLAVGAKAAGVKLFVPSEFGNVTDGFTEGVWGKKDALKKKLREEIKLPYAAFYNGPFTDYIFQKGGVAEKSGFDFVNGKITIPGSGTTEISWTTLRDVARFVAHVLTALPKNKIEGRHFRIEGDRANYNQIVDAWKARTGKDITVTYRPRSELESAVAKNPQDFVSFLFLQWDKGNGVAGKPEELDNKEFPDWKPQKVVDVLVDIYGQ
ncbi:NAD-binding protein [Fomitiporia mediterranea MF3/22]|uniref:NAD-binding protein n=1 Tax=Fomitiporia mediterranea (strain MF3/22) TaxID=694068 RepID=UPI0004408E1B|nr:NAD-binding protein [Fomitiporia mediterranea MF3/22]EJD07548.1 NAD-binding protein [Fomitiporia mediterranea MF3/22]